MSITSGARRAAVDGTGGGSLGAGADLAVVRVTLFLDALDPPTGMLELGHDGERMAFAGWVSLIGAIKTVTVGCLGRTGHEMTTPDV